MPLARLLHKLRQRRRPEAVIDRAYPAWRRAQDRLDAAYWPQRVASMRANTLISVVMPVCDPPAGMLRAAIASVQAQLYSNWDLCIIDDASTAPHVAEILNHAAQRDDRIDVQRLAQSGGIAAASNAGIARARGTHVAFMDHDDLLAPHALAAIAAEVEANPDAAMIFSDEDRVADGRRNSPYFKPGWNPDLMLGQNLVCHLAVYSRSLLAELQGFGRFLDGAQDYDLALRAMHSLPARRIRHVPSVLYHWRRSPGSFSMTHAARCQEAARIALANHLRNTADIDADAALPQWSHVQFRLPKALPSVSLLLPKGAKPPVAAYEKLEILQGRPADVASRATGEILVMLGRDLVPTDALWLHELVSHAQRPDIGAVGGALLTRRGRLAHTGFVLDRSHIAQSILPHSDMEDPGYRGHFRLMHNVAAVSGACLAVRRDAFHQAGGWNDAAGAFADVDLCLRLAARGLRTLWTPHVRLTCLRRKPRGKAGAAWMRARWGETLANDPYLNPNLVVHRNTLRLRPPRKPTA